MSNPETKEYTAEEMDALRARIMTLKNQRTLSWSALADMTGIPQGTISQWATNGYAGNGGKIAARVEKFFATFEEREATRQLAPKNVPAFMPLKVCGVINTQLVWAHSGNITTVTGEAGVGKTMALRNYVATRSNAWMITGRPSIKSVVGMLGKLVQVMGLPVRMTGVGPNVLSNHVIEHLTGSQGLIIVDEAQEFDMPAIEEFRGIHDAIGCGIVFSGNRDVLSIKSGKGAQLRSRNASRVIIDVPFAEDVDALLDAWEVTESEERKFLTAIAMKKGAGALRSMSKVLEMASMGANAADEVRTIAHLRGAAINQAHYFGGQG